MDGFFHFLQTLVLCVAGLIALTMVLFVVVMNMKSNPLRDVLTSLLWRLGVTAGVAAVAVPVQPIPGVDGAYDVGSALLLAIYWLGFLRDAYLAMRGGGSPPRGGEPPAMKPAPEIKTPTATTPPPLWSQPK